MNTLAKKGNFFCKSVSLNYIKQLGLKDNLCLKRGFSMETLCPDEYDIPVVRGGHLEGPHVSDFSYMPSPPKCDPKHMGHPCMEK